MWKKAGIVMVVWSCAMFPFSSLGEDPGRRPACKPTDICYNKKGKSLLGGAYSQYTVRCSDGSKRKLVRWKKTKKWCIGSTSSSNCTKRGQMFAAKKACAD